MRVKKVFRFLTLCLCGTSLLLGRCPGGEPDEPPPYVPEFALEGGFFKSGGDDPPSPPHYCAFSSDKTEFDLDDVTLTFYFGHGYNNLIGSEPLFAKSIFVGISDKSNLKIFHMLYSHEFFTNHYIVTQNKDNYYKLAYNHSEIITLPREYFSKDKGSINFWFNLFATEINITEYDSLYDAMNAANSHSDAFSGGGGIWIYYQVDGDKVTLSDKEFK